MIGDIDSTAKLNNDLQIPYLGLGTYMLHAGREGVDLISHALSIGYRHFDTARMYENEKAVGKAVLEGPVSREEVFVTTKLWNSDHGYDKTMKAFHRSLNSLGFDYIDLYLIHWPVENLRMESWKALETLYKDGKCKSIGVSNYTIRHLKELLQGADIVPAVNQVEFNPFLFQKDLLDFCRDQNIQLEAYSPLTKGRRLDDRRLSSIAKKYDKTTAQILIRWVLEHEVVVIPKSSNKERISQNADVFNFSIRSEDMDELDNMNENFRVSWDPSDIR